MTMVSSITRPPAPGSAIAYVAIIAFGGLLWAVSRFAPAAMPAIGPYEFSWPIWLAVTLSVLWFARGLARGAALARWRQAMFWAGLAVIWAVTQTGFEYLAQRMFFTNRLQHVAMHHLGPLLLALSAAGPVIVTGAPGWLRRIAGHGWTARVMAVLQQPVIAAVLFVGLFFFWLIPPVHFVAMLDPLLYQVMNWSMVVDGILFWALVLDTRPKPPARIGFPTRAALALAVIFPQILLGALITFATVDLFPYYAFCGRYFAAIGAVTDQQIGGLIIWISPAMMSVIALLFVISNMRRTGG